MSAVPGLLRFLSQLLDGTTGRVCRRGGGSCFGADGAGGATKGASDFFADFLNLLERDFNALQEIFGV